jgi:hypothetical protein
MKFFWRLDHLAGVDDHIAEQALARRAQLRQAGAPTWWCRRRFRHPREVTQFNDACACLLPMDHDGVCLCEHGIEGRPELYATRLVGSPR